MKRSGTKSKDAGPKRVCRFCGKALWPWYCNQQMHAQCSEFRRRVYQRDYQRRLRKDERSAMRGRSFE